MTVYRIGDVVTSAVYGRPEGASVPMLLLAAGQRIESEYQLRRLREAGFAVSSTPARDEERSERDGRSLTPSSSRSSETTFTQRLEAAQQLRRALTVATRELLAKVDAGMTPDIRGLLSTSSLLTAEVASDPYAIVALTHLRQCDEYTVEH